jgi:hypothetical protein
MKKITHILLCLVLLQTGYSFANSDETDTGDMLFDCSTNTLTVHFRVSHKQAQTRTYQMSGPGTFCLNSKKKEDICKTFTCGTVMCTEERSPLNVDIFPVARSGANPGCDKINIKAYISGIV